MSGYRKLGRPTDHRKAMLRGMVTYLFEEGKIETTVTRAKEVQSSAEKMITIARRGDLHSKRQVFSFITKEDVAKKLIDEIAPEYVGVNGGYTRIIKIGPRRGDAAEMAIIELVSVKGQAKKPVATEAKKADKKSETPAVEEVKEEAVVEELPEASDQAAEEDTTEKA